MMRGKCREVYLDVDGNTIAVETHDNGKSVLTGCKSGAVHKYFETEDGHKTPFYPLMSLNKPEDYSTDLGYLEKRKDKSV
jgi:hypothetical protein